MIEKLKKKILAGGHLTDDEAYALAECGDSKALRDAAAEITAAFSSRDFDSCSIVNARSGRCSENCKWCAQSAHFNTNCETYGLISREECMTAARHNIDRGVRRFSIVTSGRAVIGKSLDGVCDMIGDIVADGRILACASLGLIDREAMHRLKEAGIRRYHCNLETAPSHFKNLCTTHTIEDKLATIEAAHAEGLDVCSGGIIGMGESRRQRVEFALTLRRARPVSIPINILNPIPGTPLENTAPISDDEILDTVALFRFIHPATQLRFAGGRARLSRETQLEAMRIGINGAIVGDLLTTIGSTTDQDRSLAEEAGYKF